MDFVLLDIYSIPQYVSEDYKETHAITMFMYLNYYLYKVVYPTRSSLRINLLDLYSHVLITFLLLFTFTVLKILELQFIKRSYL